jgi:hypothetical protein
VSVNASNFMLRLRNYRMNCKEICVRGFKLTFFKDLMLANPVQSVLCVYYGQIER